MIEAVQRKAARFCMNNYQQKSSVTQMITELYWDSLEDRRTETRIKLMQRIINGEVEINTKHVLILQESNMASRSNSNKLQRPLVKKDTHKYSFFPRTIADWNQQSRTAANHIAANQQAANRPATVAAMAEVESTERNRKQKQQRSSNMAVEHLQANEETAATSLKEMKTQK